MCSLWPAVCAGFWIMNEDEPRYGICKVSGKREPKYKYDNTIEKEKCETCKAKDGHPKEQDQEGGQGEQSSVGVGG
jgi:hypothetical protein